jgi:HK97 family phage major capsid protein
MDELQFKALMEEQKGLILAVRAKYEDLEKSRVGAGDFTAFQAAVTTRMDEVDRMLAKLRTPPLGEFPGAVKKTDEQAEFHAKAFDKLLRKGASALTPEERKVMTVGDSTTGGYVAPVEFTNELIKGIVEYSPLRSAARVVTTSFRSKAWPTKTSSAAAAWVAETGTRAETTNPKIGLEEIPTHEMYALAKVSKQDIEDAKFDLRGFLVDEFREQFGVTEGTSFIAGTKVGQPEGVLSNAAVTGFAGVTTSGKILSDDMKQVFYLLKESYSSNATWLWKRSSTLAISLLRNAVDGSYMWQPGFQMGAPANVLGRPYLECPDMPAEANSAKAVAVGDFRRGYIIVDRIDIEVMDDPYSSKSTGCIEFSARKRVGGQVVLAEAIKILTLKA